MLEMKNFNIKEIYSVALIKPKKNEKGVIKYGDTVPRCELICKTSGEVVTRFGENVYDLRAGAVYIIPKCERIDYYVERTVPGDCIDIFFDTDTPLPPELIPLDQNANSRVTDLFQTVLSLWLTKPDGYYLKCMSAVYDILYELLTKSARYLPGSRYKRIEAGVEYIQAHLYDVIDYRMPSELCGISYTYFKKLFIESFGVPPVRYVSNMRLERSRELLLTGRYSIGETAELCGFENAYYFSKRFKQKYRISPTEYKKALTFSADDDILSSL